jgi:hypothetical protein
VASAADAASHCGDPLFKDAAAPDYHLLSGSPAIDAAASGVAPAADKDGTARYDDPTAPNTGSGATPYVDIGAYEHTPANGS